MHYSGTLENGEEFDSSDVPRRQPLVFRLGAGQVIKGWDRGLVNMLRERRDDSSFHH